MKISEQMRRPIISVLYAAGTSRRHFARAFAAQALYFSSNSTRSAVFAKADFKSKEAQRLNSVFLRIKELDGKYSKFRVGKH